MHDIEEPAPESKRAVESSSTLAERQYQLVVSVHDIEEPAPESKVKRALEERQYQLVVSVHDIEEPAPTE